MIDILPPLVSDLFITTTYICCMNCSTVSYDLFRKNAHAQVVTLKEILKQLVHLRYTSGSTNEHHVLTTFLVHMGIL